MATTTIGTFTFPNPCAALYHLKDVCSRLRPGQRILQDHPDYTFLQDVVYRHPNKDFHRPGHVEVGRSDYGTKAYFYRFDGTGERYPISLKRGIIDIPDVVRRKREQEELFRHLVVQQVRSFASSNPRVCEECGTCKGKIEVDHRIPIRKLKDDFLDQFGPFDLDIEACDDEEYPKHFVNEATTKAWIYYHNMMAELQFLCSGCHERKTEEERKWKKR